MWLSANAKLSHIIKLNQWSYFLGTESDSENLKQMLEKYIQEGSSTVSDENFLLGFNNLYITLCSK